MAAELSIAIKIGAVLGGTLAAIGSVLGGTRNLASSVSILQRQYDVLGRAIRRASASGSADLARLQRQQAELGQTLNRMNRRHTQWQAIQTRLELGRDAREKLRSEAMSVIAGVGATLLPIKVAMDFESSMADVRKVVDFDTPQQFQQMQQDLLDMTHRIPMAGKELAAIAASGGQLGIARQDIKGFTETVAKMSVAFDMSADAAGDSMAKLANVYQIPIAQIGKLGDAINHLSNSSPAKASDIVTAMGRVGGVAKQFGLTELQTASLANAFISLGKPPEVAGTAINGMLTKLQTADKQGAKFQAALKAMGTSAQELKKNIAQNGEQALLDFLKQLNKLPKADQMGTLVDLFGLEYADDVAVLAGSIETYQKSINALKDTGKDGKPAFEGSMDKEFAARSATTANNWQLFKNQMAHLAISIGSVMLPAVNDLLNSLKPMVEQFIRFSQAHPNLIKNVYLAIAAFAGFKAGSLVVRYGFSLLGSLLFGTVGKILSFNAALLRVRGAIQLLRFRRGIAAFRLLGLSARSARMVLSAFSRIGGAVSGSLRLLGSGLGWVLRGFATLGSYIPILMQGFARLGAFLLANPIGIALALLATAAYLLYTRWDGVVGGAKLLWQDLCNLVGSIANSIAAFFGNMWTTVKALFGTALNTLLNLITSFSPVTAFQAAFTAVWSWLAGLPAQFANFGRMMIDGLINGIKAKMGEAVATIQGFAAKIKGAFTGSKGMDIHSPSRVFRAYGGYITEGLAIGVNQGASLPVSRVAQLAGSLKNRFAERMGGFRSDLSARLSAGADGLRQARSEQQAQQQGASSGGVVVHFAPTINTSGGGNRQEIETALQMGLREFEQLFRRMMAERERRAY
ncbi:phage tail tape measure protein [Kingella oralis]|jgi:phage tail tape measure protein, TP901 family|uniref:phage tail tape measure protein n=1 Tax=Kingella oralis TaxID=505 RepID=UPI0034E42DB6